MGYKGTIRSVSSTLNRIERDAKQRSEVEKLSVSEVLK